MYELKVGNLMIDLVIKHYGQEGGLYQNVLAFNYTADEIIGISKELVNHGKLFLSFMNYTSSNDVELEQSEIEEVFQIVDEFTRKNASNYIYLKDINQYGLLTDSNIIEYLGKKCWNYVYECDNFEQIRNNVSDDDKEFFKFIGESLKEPKQTINNLDGYLDGAIDYLAEDSYDKIWNAVEVAIKKYFPKYRMNFYSEWIPMELSNKDLGQMAWNLIKDEEAYQYILDEDKAKITSLGELIWDNISYEYLDSIEEYLLRQEASSYNEYWEAYKAINESITKVLKENFNYFYVTDGYWMELLELGKMSYNMIGKFDSLFSSITNEIENEEIYHSCMLNLAKGIKNKSKVYKILKSSLNYACMKSYSGWTFEEWSEGFSSKDDYYKEVIASLNDTVRELIRDRIVWSNDDFIWNPIDNTEDDDNLEDIALNINFNSRFEVTKVTITKDGNKLFNISCTLPYLTHSKECKFTKELCYEYDLTERKYVLLNEDVENFIGTSFEDVYKTISKLCKKHLRIVEDVEIDSNFNFNFTL